MGKLLEVQDLNIWNIHTGTTIVHDVSFELKSESCLAIVGESGSGKTLTCRSIMRLNKPWLSQSGTIRFKGEDLNELSEKEMRKKRGKQLCMILQNGMNAFDPSCVIGVHLRETLAEHYGWNKKEIEVRMAKAMEQVMLKHPLEVMNKYPHQLSGGMLQRVMIALALVLEPDIIIADEPTTALDSLAQYEVLEQFTRLREELGCSMLFISHDLAAVKRLADEVIVMKNGELIEKGLVDKIFYGPDHEYTKYLVSSRLTLSNHFKRLMGARNIAESGASREIL